MSQFFRTLLGPRGVAPILPTAIPNLWAWYKRADVYSDAGTTLQVTNGGSIQQWSDSSGNANHLTRTDTHKPTLDTGTSHLGKATVKFDPTIAFQCLGWPLNSTPSSTKAEFFIVLKATSDAPSAIRTLWDLPTEGASVGGTQYPNTAGHIKSSFASDTLRDWGVVTVSDDFHVWNEDISHAVSVNSRKDTVSIGTASSPNCNFAKAQAFLGTDNNGSVPWAGWVFELVFFKDVISAANRAGLYSYLTSP